MKKNKTPPVDASELRRRAEARLRAQRAKPRGRLAEGESERLLHELEVHQIELELQNEELRTSRLEAEAGLQRYTELFDFAPIGYVALDTEGLIKQVNHAGASILGLERSKLVGLPFEAFLSGGDRAAFALCLLRARANEAEETCEIVMRTGLGASRRMRFTVAALAGGEPRMLLAFEDITERREREEQLARTEQALREADRRKDEFLAALSHELRNPLAPIRSSLFLLGRAEPGSEPARKALVVIDRQVTHLTRIVDELLDVTRITRGKIQLQLERVELGELVRRTMEDLHAGFEAAGIRLESRFEPRLFWVDGDPARLIQVLSNLLGNAEKFTPRGGSVLVSLVREDSRATLRVRDTGLGIVRELIPQLFEPFTQAPQTAERTRGGLGLGLAMVKGLVELHRGTARIDSEGPGLGTEVTIRLPLGSAPTEEPVAVEALPTRRRRVLVIEDNKDAADSLGAALELEGHKVQIAYDGPQGLEFARASRPEIVICDIGLPMVDGYEVARIMRAEEGLRSAFLIALTGYAQPEDLQRATAAGYDRHIAKPANLEQLERLIAEAPAAT